MHGRLPVLRLANPKLRSIRKCPAWCFRVRNNGITRSPLGCCSTLCMYVSDVIASPGRNGLTKLAYMSSS